MISTGPMRSARTTLLIEGTSAGAYNKKQLNTRHRLKNQAQKDSKLKNKILRFYHRRREQSRHK
jgi:hypothetical protein